MATESVEVLISFEPELNIGEEKTLKKKYVDVSEVLNNVEFRESKENLLVNLLNETWMLWYISNKYGGQ